MVMCSVIAPTDVAGLLWNSVGGVTRTVGYLGEEILCSEKFQRKKRKY